jgi:hypothetical protein
MYPDETEELEHLLAQWNAIVKASGSRTHGGAVGHVAGMRRTLVTIMTWDIAQHAETGSFCLPEELRRLLQQFAR